MAKLYFRGELFEGSRHLFAWADTIEEVKTICWCGRKATFNTRFDENGIVIREVAQIVLGDNDTYTALCCRGRMEREGKGHERHSDSPHHGGAWRFCQNRPDAGRSAAGQVHRGDVF